MGPHNWDRKLKQRLFEKSPYWPASSLLLKENILCACFFHLRPSRFMNRSLLDWSMSGWSMCHVLIWKWPFSRIASISLTICFAFAEVAPDPPITSTYTWPSSSFAVSGNSAWNTFTRVLMEVVAMSGAGLSPKFNLSHWYKEGGYRSFVCLLHRNLC